MPKGKFNPFWDENHSEGKGEKNIEKIIPETHKMLEEYWEKNCFSESHLDPILQLADFTNEETGKLINKFHYINTRIASNGGIPILKNLIHS